jgi:hypothetical protein
MGGANPSVQNPADFHRDARTPGTNIVGRKREDEDLNRAERDRDVYVGRL